METNTVSSGNPVIEIPNYSYELNELSAAIQEMNANMETYAAQTNAYPSTQITTIMEQLANSIPLNCKYVAYSNSASNDCYFIYGSDYSVSGNTYSFTGATVVHFYTQRVNQVTHYYYTVNYNQTVNEYMTQGALIYTDMKPGYPDFRQGLSRPANGYTFLIACFCIVLCSIISWRRRSN